MVSNCAKPRHEQAKDTGNGDEEVERLTAYSVKLKKKVFIKDPELVTLKNGRRAVRGVAEEDPSVVVVRIISDKQAEALQKAQD